MKNFGSIVVALLALASSSARADGDHRELDTVPIERPVATFMRPDGWPGYPDDNGVLTVSADGKVYVGMTLVTARDPRAAESFGRAWFAERKMRLNLGSRVAASRAIDGRRALALAFDGRDYDGPAEVRLIFVKLGGSGHYLMIAEWGAGSALSAHAGELEAMLRGIRWVGRARRARAHMR